MALNIKDPETDRLARALAAETGESITVAARRALAERLDRVQTRNRVRRADADPLGDLIRRARARGVRDVRSADEIVGYGEAGLPR